MGPSSIHILSFPYTRSSWGLCSQHGYSPDVCYQTSSSAITMLVILIEAMPLRDGIHGLYSGGCIWKFVFFASRGRNFHSRPETTFGWPGVVCKRPKGPCSSGRFSDHLYIPQDPGWWQCWMSPHTESCVQKVNVSPHAFLSATLPWSPYSTPRSPGMQ